MRIRALSFPSPPTLMDHRTAGFFRVADETELDASEKQTIRNVLVQCMGLNKPVLAYASITVETSACAR